MRDTEVITWRKAGQELTRISDASKGSSIKIHLKEKKMGSITMRPGILVEPGILEEPIMFKSHFL